MNKLQILGTITRETEIKYTQSGAAICSFSIAYNESYKDKEGKKKDTAHFFDVTAFGKTGEAINTYFQKGSRILIDGSLDYSSWKAQDGTNRSAVKIKLNGFDFIDRKSDTQPIPSSPQANQPPSNPVPQSNIPEIDVNEDEIPF